VAVPDRAFSPVVRHLKILGQLQSIGRARIFAQTAKHAPRSVVREKRQYLSPRCVIPFPSHYDQVLRARKRTQVARYAKRLARLRVLVQPGRSAVAFRHHRPFQWVLLSVNVAR